MRQRQTEIERDTHRDTERDTERQRETERHRETQRERETERHTQRERGRQRKRERRTTSPSKTMFSPRIRKRPSRLSAYVFLYTSRWTVSSITILEYWSKDLREREKER